MRTARVIMKTIGLILLFLLVGFNGFSQDRRMSLSRKGATIDSILDDIEKKTDYLFIYRKGVNVMLKKDVSVHDKPVSEILTSLFDGTGISYSMEGNYIVLTQTEAKKTPQTVSGLVTDSDGVPLVGVVVSSKQGRTYSLTDSMGKYSIELAGRDELQFSCMGYERYSMVSSPGEHRNVVMAEKYEMMEETVAIGFGVQTKSDVTGSITSIDNKIFANKVSNNIVSAITGVASGIQVISTSGDPDAVGDIRIRGLSSNSSSANTPLFIVDGLLVKSIKQINQQDIESIEILKDAASAAIYGAQAGNGVVVITTKTGHEGSGHIFYNGSYRIERLGWRQKMMNSAQYIDFMTSSGIASPGQVDEYWNGVADTDWQSEMFPGGFASSHNIGLEGGYGNGKYYASVSYLDNDGIVYGDKDRLKRVNFQFNASYQVKDWVKIGSTNTLHYKQTSAENGSMGDDEGSIVSLTYAMSPLSPLTYSPDNLPGFMNELLDNGYNLLKVPSGDYIALTGVSSSTVNPLVKLYRKPESVNENLDLLGTLFVELKPWNLLTFTSRFGYTIENYDDYEYEEPWYAGEQHYEYEYSLEETVKWKLGYQWENYFNFRKTLAGAHNIDFMAGMSYIETNSRSVTGKTNELKDYLPNFRYLDFSTSTAIDNVSGTRKKEVSLSYFSRLSYNYSNRYYLQLSFRADAFDTSRLSASNRWGYFPSVSAGWTVTNEPWMSGVDKSRLSFLKLRACWGVNGNIGVLSGYPYASTITIGGSSYALGTDGSLTLASYPSKLANESLKWEESVQTDLGIDARFLDSRLTATLDIYDKHNNGLLVSATPSYTTGQTSVYLNAGSVRNTGIEFELGWKDTLGDFFYQIDANISRNKNMVTYLDPSVTRISGANVNNGHKCTYFEKGYPIWYMYGYVYDGVDPETGNNMIRDLDGNGKITTADMTMVGCAQPDFTYGVNLMAQYKGFDLAVSGYGSQGNDIWFSSFPSNSLRNLPEVFYTKAWRQPGDIASYPRIGQTVTSAYARSSACVYDGSYFRLSQLQLGYSLPEKLVSKIMIDKLRLYVSLDDFWTISDYVGYDPVTAGSNSSSGNGIDRGSYPIPRKFTVGVNISL